MAKNGFNSVPSVRVISRGLDTEWKSWTGTKAKGGIKTILDQFRNSHARWLARRAIGNGDVSVLSEW
jgi:hypothetical protein